MAFIEGKVTVEEIDEEMWLLLEPVIYQGKHQKFEVPAGFTTDFASVPRAFVWLIPRYGKYTKAAILHDYLCAEKPVNRSDADGIFRRAMRELGVSFLRRWIMWAAVRAGCRFESGTLGEFLVWLLIAIPSVAFLLVPYMVTVIWAGVFWLIETVVFILMKPVSKKRVNPPKIFGVSANK